MSEQIPQLPEIPTIPDIPKIPEIPTIPDILDAIDNYSLEQIQALIFDSISHDRMMSFLANSDNRTPTFCDYMITGLVAGHGQMLGYVTQIRRKAGIGGTDKVFLRHPDGSLMVHENQCFWIISPEWKPVLDHFFDIKPDVEKAENPEIEYRCCDKITAKGFIVEPGAVPESNETLTFGLTITHE